ncbi:MAG: glycosyltransferase family 4 protein, partial [Victivallaceae bacterium]|nr:glycosyltransferase family 4 protein [Victivallaceae bacterium]
RKILMDYYNVPPERVQTVYNGFDFSEFNYDNRDKHRSELCLTYNIDPRKTIILFAANNYIRKGLPQAVDSILQTSNPDNFTLVVIGRGRTSIKKNLQRKLSGKTQAVWLDHVKNPAKYYRSADVFLFPTLYDSFANVIGEALACGLPVITTQQAGGAEMILRDENGFVAKHATIVNDLSNYLEKFTDRDLCAEFSKRAPEIVSQYTIDRCAEETEKVLLKAFSQKSGD